MFICSQYYRPPFPDKKYWDEDLDLMKSCNLTALQLWALWGWIESEPGKYNFDDYDEIIEKAKKRGLKIIISTIAEIHPFWIHREIPDSHMIDHMGNKVISTARLEVNHGLTPGGCFDNPKVLELMGKFLAETGERYANEKELIGWDCWNETRWAVQADGYVCYCPYTIARFRDWLKGKYGSLEGLNEVWKRRYVSWDDVYPGKLHNRTYVEMTEFLKFMTWRAGRHMKFRYDCLKQADKNHLVSAHCATPALMSMGGEFEQPLSRGNDWDLADQLDGFGCSHFPFWGAGFDFSGFGVRVETIRSANRGKTMWVSELQGGAVRHGFNVYKSVTAMPQQMWVWNGIARGAKGIIFWCWKDEVFGRESAGFGLAGLDGLAGERLKELNKTMQFMNKHNDMLENYMPDPAKVGVLFEEDNYYLNWASDGNSSLAGKSILGYLSALEKLQIPYEVLESNHFEIPESIRLIIMPWALVVNEKIIDPLCDFISKGGTVLCEGELSSFDMRGFWHFPGGERELANRLKIEDLGRRIVDEKRTEFSFGGKKFNLIPSGWFNSLKSGGSEILAKNKRKEVVAVRKIAGKGGVIAIGTFLGMRYYEKNYPAFENFIECIVDKAGGRPGIGLKSKEGLDGIQWKSGVSKGARLIFVINAGRRRKLNVSSGKEYRLSVGANSWNVFKLGDKTTRLE